MKKNPNVILITIDDMRADRLSCNGYHRNTTPFIDSLANQGHLFKQNVANGTTSWPSFSSIMTSVYPMLFGGYADLSPKRKTIAEVVKSLGYHTLAFQCSPYLKYTKGYERGLDEIDFMDPSFLWRLMRKLRNTMGYYTYKDFGITADQVNKSVILDLKDLAKSSNPFFLWLYYLELHYPLIPHKDVQPHFMDNTMGYKEIFNFHKRILHNTERNSEEDLKILSDIYDSSILFLDKQIENFIGQLKQVGLYDNTYIIIASDHGEKMGERDGMVGHTSEMYEELIRVPLIIIGPDIQHNEINRLVSNLDIGPTIVDIIGSQPESAFMGNSVFNSETKTGIDHGYFIEISHKKSFTFDLQELVIAYRSEEWKYIWEKKTGLRQLYNLKNDPGEKNNVIGSAGEVEKELKSILDKHLKEIETKPLDELNGKEKSSNSADDLDEKIKKELKELGYLD